MDDDKNDLLLPKKEQITRDFFRKGDRVQAVIDRVDNNNGNPKIYLSRTSPMYLRQLLRREIPEIAEGVIVLHDVARIPGERAKISVESYDPNIDLWVLAWAWAVTVSAVSCANSKTKISTSSPSPPTRCSTSNVRSTLHV